MSITVQDRLLRMADVVGEARTSLIMQQTLDVPADHPDIERVVGVGALPVITEVVAEDGRVVVRGRASLSLVYAAIRETGAGENEELRATEAPEAAEAGEAPDAASAPGEGMDPGLEAEHRESDDDRLEGRRRSRRRQLHCIHFPELAEIEAIVDMPEVKPGMTVRAEIMTEHIAHNLVNRRRLGVDASLEVRVRVDHFVECRAVVDVVASGSDRASVRKERVHIDNLVVVEYQDRDVEAVIVLPDAKPDLMDIAEIDTMVSGVVARVEDGRVIVDGAVAVDMMYICDAVGMAPMHHVHAPEAGRFSHSMAIVGVRAGHRVESEIRVAGVSFVPMDRRMVRVVARLRIGVRVTEPQDLEVVTEVTSDTRQVDVLRRTVHIRGLAFDSGRDAMVAGALNLPPTKPPIDAIVRATAAFTATEVRATNGRAVIEGDLSFRVTYIGAMADLPVHIVDFPKGLHVAQQVDVPGLREGMTVEPEVTIQALDLDSVDPDTIQVKVVLRIRACCYSLASIELICDFVVVSPCPPGTSMRVVVVQPGDTLWKLSRQFGTTVEEIVRLNNIPNPDLIFPGQRFRIPCVPSVPTAPVMPVAGRG